MIKLIVDAMGGDNAPASVVEGAVKALEQDKELYLILTGRKDAVEAELAKFPSYDKSRLEIVDCPDVIEMNDIPTEAVKSKKNSSLVQGFWMLKKQDDICGLVTAGSTGATIVAGQTILGRIRGIRRPGLCPAIPNSRGTNTYLCDCGANAECKPVMLCQFALLASAYAEARGVKNPKVGLLNNGSEEHKGDPLHQETYQYLSKMEGINFIGNIEGRDIVLSDVDVVVSDGFSGNIAIKSLEGCGKMVLKEMKTQFTSSLSSKIGALFLMGAVKRMKKDLDFERVGGALLLGVKKVVLKAHGSSKAKTITNAVLAAADTYRGGLVPAIEERLSQVDFDSLIPQEV